MKQPRLIAFQGPTSQTGLAAKAEFPDVPFGVKSETFDDIAVIIRNEASVAALPMWNSHKGEITESKALQLLFDNEARLLHLWPGVIRFECVVRSAQTEEAIETVISVHVAKIQCSQFLKKTKAEFKSSPSTVLAYEKFRNDASIDAVLCAPGQNTRGFVTLRSDVANPVNFTTFALLGGLASKEWPAAKWGELHSKLTPERREYAGVQMPIRASMPAAERQWPSD